MIFLEIVFWMIMGTLITLLCQELAYQSTKRMAFHAPDEPEPKPGSVRAWLEEVKHRRDVPEWEDLEEFTPIKEDDRG